MRAERETAREERDRHRGAVWPRGARVRRGAPIVARRFRLLVIDHQVLPRVRARSAPRRLALSDGISASQKAVVAGTFQLRMLRHAGHHFHSESVDSRFKQGRRKLLRTSVGAAWKSMTNSVARSAAGGGRLPSRLQRSACGNADESKRRLLGSEQAPHCQQEAALSRPRPLTCLNAACLGRGRRSKKQPHLGFSLRRCWCV
jgi:hypothetical protein